MTIGIAFEFPEDKRAPRDKSLKLAWLSIVLLTSAATLLFFALGQSEAMKTAWVSDVLTAVPPMALLLATRFERRTPSTRFPFGYTRAVAVAFLVTSAVLSLIGMYLFYDAVMKLLRQERPPIGTMELFGHEIWAGWPMIVALGYSMVCGLAIGLLKKPVAKALTDKALNAEAAMNRAEWLSEGAAIVGIILVGFGHWWGDALAAAFISVEIVRDGWMNTRLVIGDLMDESPTTLGGAELEGLTPRVRDAIRLIPSVAAAGVRLREHGRAITGEAFVVFRPESHDALVDHVAEVSRAARAVDWRIHEVTVMPVAKLDNEDPPVVR